MDNVLVLLDAKDLQKAITKGIVKGFLTVTVFGGVAKFALRELKKREEENKKASEVEETSAPDEE